MLSPLKRVHGFLRSRKLAVSLLLAVMVWSFTATIVPQVSRDPGKVAPWGVRYPVAEAVVRPLGLHDAYRSPLFLGVMALLFASTTVCAWERARASLRQFSASKGLTEAEIGRLSASPRIRVAAPAGVRGPAAKDVARVALRRIGLRLRSGARVGEAAGGRWGLLGSPLFHVSLAALFLVIGLGQLTRAEGLIGVPVGDPVADTESVYGRYDAGPWYSRGGGGLTIGTSDFALHFRDGGVDRGSSAVVTLVRGGAEVARQRVYPNNPLRFGSIMIHQNDYGLAAALQVEEASGTVLTDTRVLSDFDPNAANGMTAAQFRIDGASASASSLGVSVAIQADHEGRAVLLSMPKRKAAKITVTGPAGYEQEATLVAGDALVLPSGQLLRLVDIVYYARLSVVDDWSVYPIYALFVIAAIGLSLAVFTPYRVVRLLLVEDDGGLALHADARHARRDPLFTEKVEDALREALDALGTAVAVPDPDSEKEEK